MSKKESQPARGPDPKQARYSDGSPLDEVHYLQDPFRGGVWEEVIINLAPTVRLISLSATVSNAEEFGEWLGTVRGDTDVVVEERRPVPVIVLSLPISSLRHSSRSPSRCPRRSGSWPQTPVHARRASEALFAPLLNPGREE